MSCRTSYSCMLHNKCLVSNRLPISWWLGMIAVGLTTPLPTNISAYAVLPHSAFFTVWVTLMQPHLLIGQCRWGSSTGAGKLLWEAACLASVKKWAHVPKTTLKTVQGVVRHIYNPVLREWREVNSQQGLPNWWTRWTNQGRTDSGCSISKYIHQNITVHLHTHPGIPHTIMCRVETLAVNKYSSSLWLY